MNYKRFQALLVASIFAFTSLQGANVVVNGSFDDTTIILNNGNNLNVSVSGWTITDAMGTNPNPTNLVLPFVGYGGGPDTAQDGIVYFDGNGTDVQLFQDFQIIFGQTVNFSAYFSRRDNLAANGNNLKIFNSAGTSLLATSTTINIPNTTSQELWFFSEGNVFLGAGTYQLRIDLPNAANVDNVVINVIPEPATGALLLLSGIGLLQRRRRASR